MQFVDGFLHAGAFQQAGFFITIFGFVVTAIAAIKALRVATKISDKIIALDKITDVATAISLIDEIRRNIRVSAWVLLPDRCTELRQLLVRLNDNEAEYPDIHYKALKKAITEIRRIEDLINIAGSTGLAPDKANDISKLLRDHSDKLNELSIEIKRRAK